MNFATLLAATVLNLVYPVQSNLTSPVKVEFVREENNLVATFEVQSKTLNVKQKLGPKEYPFQFDVVELFISVDGLQSNLPYYEFELTPLGQTFEVKIIDPKTHRIDGVNMGVKYSTQRTPTGWIGRMSIPLQNLGWKGDVNTIRGNAFAVLGHRPNRSYWSLFLPAQKKPNFHLPEFFQPLLKP